MDSDLKGKVVLVTGAAGGIGSEVTRTLVREGARVIVHYRSSEAAARGLIQEVGEDNATAIAADLTREDEVARLFTEGERRLGPVSHAVLNAGIWAEKEHPIVDLELAQWNHTLTNNLTSMFLCLRQFFRGIRQHQIEAPAAVLVGSTAAIYGEAGHADYAASKSGAIGGLLLTAKNELARLTPRGRINAVSPSWVFTPMTKEFQADPGLIVRVLQTRALRRVARPEDVAHAITFLLSEKLAGHLTGVNLPLSGGMEGRLLYAPHEIDSSLA
jgi:3-oxoacyl-[acyl-carrier protein] reductase